jgi:hypothetical protein
MFKSIFHIINKKAFICVSYLNVLFFFEIINLMFFLTLVFGKYISIAAGIALTILLSVQIIGLYFKNKICMVVQLFLMDIHLAYSIPFLVFFVIYFQEIKSIDIIFVSIRSVIAIFEILFIAVIGNYKIYEENISIS